MKQQKNRSVLRVKQQKNRSVLRVEAAEKQKRAAGCSEKNGKESSIYRRFENVYKTGI